MQHRQVHPSRMLLINALVLHIVHDLQVLFKRMTPHVQRCLCVIVHILCKQLTLPQYKHRCTVALRCNWYWNYFISCQFWLYTDIQKRERTSDGKNLWLLSLKIKTMALNKKTVKIEWIILLWEYTFRNRFVMVIMDIDSFNLNFYTFCSNQ